ncbi:cytochrome c3 family protein [Thermodesulfobacteriota bacterium]
MPTTKPLYVSISIIFILLVFSPAKADDNTPTWVGAEICSECHEKSFKDYSENRHGVARDPRTPAAGKECEACLGPGSIHVEQQDPEAIISWTSKASKDTDKKNRLCLSCHFKGKMALWNGSNHESRGLLCADCHTIHQNKNKNLLKSDQTSTCT